MADIPINPVTRRVEFTGNTGTGPFAFTFNVLAQADVAAYKNNTLLALTSDYTVSLNSNGTGSITLTSALIATDELVIIGDLALSRTTDFVTAGDLLASSLNEQFDSNVVMSQQLDERFDRTIRSQPGDINKNLYLPLVSSRASQLLSFDSSGNITTTSLSNVPDIGTVNLTVSGVASFADGSASAPSITNIGDTNTGMYFGAADQINFSVGGSEVISVASTGTTISGLSISSGDILLTDNSATALEIKEGSNNYLTFITTNGSEKLSFGSTANPTFEVNGSFRQPLIGATTSFFSQTYSGATLSATNGSVNIESYSASKAGIVLNGSGDQITFTSPTLGFVGLVQVVGAITTNTSLNIASSTTVTGILDEDNMASNSATKLATQQSIKAYVDAQVGTVDTLAEVLGNGNTTGSNNIIVTAGQSITVDTISETTAANGVVIDGVTLKDGGATVTADVTFGDNDKAIFGAGSDLQIYHDGLHSYIEEAGTGRLHFKSNSYIFYNAAGTERAIDFLENDEVRLYFDGDEKLATTSTGVDITGTLTSDGLTVDGDTNSDPSLAHFYNINTGTAAEATAYITNSATKADGLFLMQLGSGFTTADGFVQDGSTIGSGTGASGGLSIMTRAAADMRFYTNGHTNERLRISSNGDISFYEDTGSTAKLVWTAADESLGIGGIETTDTYPLMVKSNSSHHGIHIEENSGGEGYTLGVDADGDLGFYNSGAATASVTFDDSGSVGIGTSSPGMTLDVNGSSGPNDIVRFSGPNSGGITFRNSTSNELVMHTATSDALIFGTNGNNERMRIDSSGNVGIGTSSPSNTLSVEGSGTGLNINSTNDEVKKIAFENSGSPTGYIGSSASSPLRFLNGSATEYMRIDSSGNVGIAESTPLSPLHINVGTDQNLRVFTANSAPTIGSLNDANSAYAALGYTGSQHEFRIGTSEAMRIDSSGNLIIASTGGTLQTATAGTSNFRAGVNAGNSIASGGNYNVVVGDEAGTALTTGDNNVAIGFEALSTEDAHGDNVAIGYQALKTLNAGADGLNVAVGYQAGNLLQTGTYNTFLGPQAGFNVTTGSNNTIVGQFDGNNQGLDIRTASNNIVLSDGAGAVHLRTHVVSSSQRQIEIGHYGSGSSNQDFVTFLAADGDSQPSAANKHGLILSNGISGAQVKVYAFGTGSWTGIEFLNTHGHTGQQIGSITLTENATAYNTSSDYRLKTDAQPMTGATDRLKQLNPVNFEWIADGTRVDGFLAHEAQAVVPEAVTGTKDAVDVDGNPDYQGIDQSKLVPLLVATIQELEARITALENA